MKSWTRSPGVQSELWHFEYRCHVPPEWGKSGRHCAFPFCNPRSATKVRRPCQTTGRVLYITNSCLCTFIEENLFNDENIAKAIMARTPATTFPQFPSLPIELQIIIWHFAGKAVNVNPQLCGLFFTILSDIRLLHRESAYASLIRCAPYEIFQVKYFAATSPLLATCILARLCVLKEWKKQIMMHSVLIEGFSRPPDMLRRALVRDLEDKIGEVEDGLKRRQDESGTVISESVEEEIFFDVAKSKDEIEVVGNRLLRGKEAVNRTSGEGESEEEFLNVFESTHRHARRHGVPKI